MIKIAVDCMGGDSGLSITLPACKRFLAAHPDAYLILVGNEAELQSAWQPHARAEICHAPEVVLMDDSIETAMRHKRASSMRIAISAVKEGRADAALSAGNTGALMAISRYVLKTLDGIDRPAIASQMPNIKGSTTTMLDLGANVDCTPAHLLQFALMGSALVACLRHDHPQAPTVGLLNVGEEVIKGGDVIKAAAQLLQAAADNGDLSFYGNVEGNDIYKGTTDIVVCDGFVGNVALKASEGLANMLGQYLKTQFSRNFLSKMAGIFAYPALRAFKKQVDHRRYNGAALLGLRGLVFKSHGSADAFAFEMALEKVYDAAKYQLLDRLKVRIAHARSILEPIQIATVKS